MLSKTYSRQVTGLVFAGGIVSGLMLVPAMPAFAQATCGTYAGGTIVQPASGQPTNLNDTACGTGATATNGTAIGAFAEANSSSGGPDADNAVAIGRGAEAINIGAIAIGGDANSDGTAGAYSIAVGSDSNANGFADIAIGADSTATNGTAIGYNASASAPAASGILDRAIAIGTLANADNEGAVAIGSATNLLDPAGAYSVSLGSGASSSGTTSIAIGGGGGAANFLTDAAEASGDSSIAVGAESNATATNAVALGTDANATHANSVALGSGSTTTATNQVHVGGRTIGGVASGVAATDAVNVSQLTAATVGITADITAIEAAQASMALDIDTLFDLRGRDRRDMKQGVAAAMSMANAPMPSAPGRISYAVSGATFRGEYAVGGSMQYRLNTENPMAVNVGVSFAGNKNNGLRVGVAGEF